MASKSLAAKLGMDTVVFEGLEHRSRVPVMLRDMVQRGCVEVTLSMSAQTALKMAADLEFAIQERPLGQLD